MMRSSKFEFFKRSSGAALGAILLFGSSACGNANPSNDLPDSQAVEDVNVTPASPTSAGQTTDASDPIRLNDLSEASSNQTDEGKLPRDTMIVLDSSGSMWGQINGVAKRDIALQALQEFLPDLIPRGNIGLVAYGHRREGDCGDIEILHQALPGERESLVDTAKDLNARGKTPLTQAVRVAADSLSIKNKPASIVLITDGLETCDADPCALGKELADEGIDFTAHVIGFGLNQDEGRQVACLAEETGGLYLEARNADELDDAFAVVADSEKLPSDNDIVAPASVEIIDTSIAATALFNVKWEGPQNSLDSLVIRSIDGETKYDRVYVYRETDISPATMTAPELPGNYGVHYETRRGRSLATTELTVLDVSARITVPSAPVIAGTSFQVSFSGPENEFDRIQLFTEASEESDLSGWYVTQAENGELSLVAPPAPGTYFVRYLLREGRVIAEEKVIVISPAASIRPPDDAVVAGAYFVTSVSDAPGQSDKVIIVDPENARKPIDEGYVQHAKNGEVRLLAPQQIGTYEMRYIDGMDKMLASATLTVVSPDTSIFLPEQPIRVGEDLEIGINPRHGEFDKLVLVSQSEPDKEIDSIYINSARNGKLKFFSPITEPGTYILQYQNRGGDILESFTIESSE